MENLFQILGKRIQQERKKRGLTQEKLAEGVGVSNNFISYIESGKKAASLKTIKKIADVLGVSVHELFKDFTRPQKTKSDYTMEQILYLIKDKSPSTKRLFLRICKSLVDEKKE